MKVFSFEILTAADMSMVQSATQQLEYAFAYNVQAVWSGVNPTGTITLSASIDNITYDYITNSQITFSGAGSFMWNVSNAYYNWVLVTFTPSDGSEGSLNVTVNYKGA